MALTGVLVQSTSIICPASSFAPSLCLLWPAILKHRVWLLQKSHPSSHQSFSICQYQRRNPTYPLLLPILGLDEARVSPVQYHAGVCQCWRWCGRHERVGHLRAYVMHLSGH